MIRRPSSKLALALTIATFISLGAGAASAQEQSDGFNYFYVVTARVEPGQTETYTEGIAAIVAASKKHNRGNNFATYVNFTGEGTWFSHFIALQALSDMDSWISLPQLMSEIYGAEKGGAMLATLGTSAQTENRLLALVPELSNPPTAGAVPVPPPVLLFAGYRVSPEGGALFAEAAGKWAAAARKNPKAAKALAYSTMIGGDQTEFSFFTGLSKFGDLDGAPTVADVLTEAVGAREAARLAQKVGETSTAQTMILTFVPELSNIPEQ